MGIGLSPQQSIDTVIATKPATTKPLTVKECVAEMDATFRFLQQLYAVDNTAKLFREGDSVPAQMYFTLLEHIGKEIVILKGAIQGKGMCEGLSENEWQYVVSISEKLDECWGQYFNDRMNPVQEEYRLH